MRRADPRPARAARLAAVLALGLLLLATTQPWWSLDVRLAPGLPHTSLLRSPSPAGWAGAHATVAALCLLGAVARPRPWLRVLALLALAGALAGVVLAGAAPPGTAPAEVLRATTTGWYAAALVGASLALVLGLVTEVPLRRGPSTDRPSGPRRPAGTPVDAHEQQRRADDRAWRELSDGRDPTLGP